MVSPEIFALVAVIYVIAGVAAIIAVRRQMPARAERVWALATLAALWFTPTLILGGHGAFIGPWWLPLGACLLGDCGGGDQEGAMFMLAFVPLVAAWALFLAIGFSAYWIGAWRRTRR